ncbi:F-box/LRR-repeat protein At3g48880-like [Glycine soja]|uniref:F-box/LRR-repeat protein n=1 Tax=Glycine soja TaxID=3848 RepID=A0A0B2SMR9_GLYSO|nr:F-box/LRR-repeat protein At3g48880-like [Glycine soja]KAG4946815.1 hypothetical protein JHK87_042822 [Glycine soja]KHN45572.1 F-box/LRR-repeat protein [Glycine soja]
MDNSKSAAMKGVWRNDLWSTEILITIFMSVNIVDLAVASLVCKMWNTACRDPSLWGKIDLSTLNNSYFFNIPNNQPGAYKRTSGKITQFLKTPNLKQLVLPRKGDFSRKAVHMAMKSWGGLESINISSGVPTDYIFPAIHEYCKSVNGIKFHCEFEEKHAEALIESTPNLKVFSIRSTVVSMKALRSVLTSVEHLEAVNIYHSFIMDMSHDEFSIFAIQDLRKYLPPSKGYLL